MSWIDIALAFLFWLLTNLLSYRVGRNEGKKIVSKMIGKNIRNMMLLALIPLAMACSSAKPALMTYTGSVILVNDCEVCVSYGNVGESDNSKTFGCFAHYEGHSYQVGDTYPDPDKHSTGIPMQCGTSSQTNSPKHKKP